MLFNSTIFIFIFIPILIGFYFFTNKTNYRNNILIIFSFFFYFFGEPAFSLFIIFTLILDFNIAKFLAYKKKSSFRKYMLFLGVFYNLSILFVFKYLSFFLGLFDIPLTSIMSHTYATKFIFLPLAISFITFTKISFLVDVYREEIKCPSSINELLLYILFFPQLIAGPILRYSDIEKQITSRSISLKKFKSGVSRFIYGLAKKVLLADQLTPIIEPAFDINLINSNPFSLVWLGIIAFSFQIYLDFSAYSDMAVGLGRMFGINIPENFKTPYLSKSIQDFWKRWHITLRRWFILYVYIPLQKIIGIDKDNSIENNYNFKVFTGENFGNLSSVLVVFLLSGLWHGASLNFVLWGFIHGICLIVERVLKPYVNIKNPYLKNFIVIFIVFNSWVLFRTNDLNHALLYFQKMYGLDKTIFPTELYAYFPFYYYYILIISIFIIWIFEPFVKDKKLLKKIPYSIDIIIIFLLFIICISVILFSSHKEFLYFRF